jgi:hypothetical protein
VIEESLSKNKQHSCKAKKQEVEQQEHKTVWNQEKHQGLSYELDLLKKMQNTLSISCIHASVLQSVHTTSNHWNICWTWQRISSWEHSRKQMISEKPTISSNERGTTPLKTHENS